MEQLIESALQQTMMWLPKATAALLLLLGFYLLARLVRRGIERGSGRLALDYQLTALFARSSSVTLIVVGLVTALGTLGVDVSALVAGLGLTGFALGFALKDTISNLLSGVMVLIYQPFRIGDSIAIAGFEGEVMAIDLRYTELRGEGKTILIPNAKLFTDPISVLRTAAKGE